MTKKRKTKRAMARAATFDERVANADKQTTYAKSNDLFVHPVRTNRTQRIIGRYPSQVMGGMLPYHSELERILLKLLDMTIGVLQFFPQAETFDWSDGKCLRRYTPDCGAVTAGPRIMIETKYEDEAAEPENVEVRELSAPFLKAKGWELLLLTEVVLKQEHLVRNIATIRRRRNHPFHEMAMRQIHQDLDRTGTMSFADCAAVATAMGGDADMLYTAIGRRELYCNLWEPLTEKSNLIHPNRAPRPFLLELLGVN